MKKTTMIIMSLAVGFLVFTMCGCEHGDSEKSNANVTTEILSDRSIRTVSRDPVTHSDGILTQTTTTVTHPDGTAETHESSAGATVVMTRGNISDPIPAVPETDAAPTTQTNPPAFPGFSRTRSLPTNEETNVDYGG